MTDDKSSGPQGSLLLSRPTVRTRIVRLVLVGVIDALLISIVPGLIAASSWTLLALVGVVALMVNVTYLWPRAQAARWLTPGLVFMLLFVVWPVIYTGYVSLTNYQTGNTNTKVQAITNLERQVIQGGGASIPLQLEVYRNPGGEYAFFLVDPDGATYFGVPRPSADVPVENPLLDPESLGVVDDGDGIPESIGDYEYIPPLGRFQIANEIGTLVLDIPGSGLAQVQTTSAARLVAGGFRYRYDEATDTLFDAQENVTCPVVEGSFVCPGGRRLDPGWVTFIGVRNFADIFSSTAIQGPFLRVFAWNLVFAALSVVLTFALGLTLASALQDDRLRGKALYRSLLIIPYAMPGFIAIIIWRGLLNDQIGPVNSMLNSLGITDIPWLLNPWWARASLLLVNLWLGFPYMFLICSGALQAVPAELKEAARVDGAGPATVFRNVTLPLLLVATTPLLIGSFAFNFNNFVLPFLLTNGGPPVAGAAVPVGHTDLLITFTFDLAISGGRGNRFALGSAIVILIFVIVATLSALSFRLTKRLEEVYGGA